MMVMAAGGSPLEEGPLRHLAGGTARGGQARWQLSPGSWEPLWWQILLAEWMGEVLMRIRQAACWKYRSRVIRGHSCPAPCGTSHSSPHTELLMRRADFTLFKEICLHPCSLGKHILPSSSIHSPCSALPSLAHHCLCHHRITEWLRLKAMLEVIVSSPPCSGVTPSRGCPEPYPGDF